MGFENQVEQQLFKQNSEKSHLDKALARKDVDDLREIIKKTKLERTDILEILYLLTSTESKLLNYQEWDRYVILKLFVWIRDFVKVAEQLYDYQDRLDKGEVKLPAETKKLLENNKHLIEHNIKFLVDLYLNIGRTTLSLKGKAFNEILNNKYEFVYPNMQAPVAAMPPQRKGWLSR